MKKPTILRMLIFVLAMLFNFASYSQNGIADNSKFNKNLNENIFLKANSQFGNPFRLEHTELTSKKDDAFALDNPVIPYAQLPYAGQVTKCPNDGKLLPKLFLCGGNDSRLIDTKITDAQSIIWERFVSGGTCATVSNSDCATEAPPVSSCWNQVGTGQEYLANSAGQFRVKIVDNTGTPYIFYFNVYQNTLVPTATTKSDIIRNSAGTCQINGKITVGGFGAGYQYSFTTTGSSGAWQDSNVFTTATPGNYTAYIRIKGVVGSCEFKVINLDIKNVNFAVTTSIASPKCSGATGSVQVITNDIKQEYTYTIYSGTNTSGSFLNQVGPTESPNTTFTGLFPGTYTILTAIKGSTCAPEKNTVVIANAPNPITSGASITTALGACSSGQITITRSGGTAPYKFFVNTNGAGFAENPTNIIVVTQPGSYVIRVEDANGCVATNNVTVNVPAVTKPIYTINKVDGDCKGNVGKISLNVTNNNTYNLVEYSIDNGANFSPSTTVFDIPSPGSYRVIVRYRKNVTGTGSYCTEPAVIVTVGPSIALTASAGVGELSGCGPVGKELYGLVRIVNPQGGTPPYKYSFDDKKSWVDNNTQYMDYGGPYTVYIKDDLGCEYAMGGITIDKKPDAPTIKVLDPVFNCDGSATTTVTVTNSGSGDPKYSYDYYMDGVLNTSVPTNVFKNVTQGDHTVTVKYNVLKVTTYSNLLQEDFGKGGFTTTPGINPAYCFEDEAFTHLLPGYACNKDEWINDGEYAVASQIRTVFSTWLTAKDHTLPTDKLGRFLAVNVGGTAGIGGILYSKPIKDVIANQPVIISLWAENLIKTQHTSLHDPKLTIELVNNLNGVGGTETIVASSDPTPGHTNPWQIPKSEKWEYKELSLNPGAYTNLSFVVRSYSNEFNGNDVLIDDIWVRQIPKSCNTVADFPIIVDGSKAFSAGITGYKDIQCSGDQNGEITLSAKNFDPAKGFQYSVDGGAWQTVIPVPAANYGSKTLTGLTGKVYNIRIRYDDSANSCTFPLAQEIKIPKALKVKASVTTLLTCDFGATITAEASDGTPGYEYELRATDGVTVIPGHEFSADPVFLNVPKGNYKVIAKDLNACQTAVLASVDVVDPVYPKIAFDSSDLCFTASAQIIVRITQGVGPNYTYTTKFNSNPVSVASAPFQGPTFTFNATQEGTYVFRVKDLKTGCESEPITKIINTKLTTVTPVTTPLDCDPAPNNRAVITGTISGGQTPFVVTLTAGNSSGTLVQPTVTGNTFTYTTAISGNYSFQIKDGAGCISTSDATINPLVNVTGSVVKATNPNCFDSSTGQVQLSGGGGSGKGYEFSFNGSGFTSKSLYTDLDAKTTTANTTVYKYQIKDSNDCLSPIYEVTLNNPSPVVASANFPANTNCSSSVTITVTGNGGSGGYEYSFKGSTTYTGVNTLVVNLTTAPQTISYSVKDSNGCINTKTINVPAYNPPTGITFSTPAAITCEVGKTTTSVTLTPKSGGVSPFTYLMTSGTGSGASNTTGIFSGLTAGSYGFQITDANGCKSIGSITIAGAATIAVSGKKTDVKCVGLSNGTATFTVTGASSVDNFTYVLSPASGTATLLNDVVTVTGLGTGTYTLQVKDKSTGCSSNVASVTINPATAITITGATASKVNCGNSISNIVVTATGGVPNYKYAYVLRGAGMPAASAFSDTNTTINTGATQSNLLWDVYVMDQNDCTAGPFNLDIQREASPTVKSPAPATFCFKSPSTTTIDLRTFFNLGTGTHTYTVNTVAVTNPAAYNITASGTYAIVVRDANGCPATATYIVNPELTILATRVKDLTCDNDAEISFAANGGSNTYSTYQVQINGAGAWSTVTSPYTTANSGTYQFRVTDNANCQGLSNVITITPKTTPSFAHNEKQPTCIGAADGVINITNPTGLAPFTYLITKGVTTVSTTATANNLNAGVYNVLLTDAKGCTFSLPITLSDPAALTATVQSTPLGCNTDNTTKQATITVTSPAGGTGTGYEYSFNGGAFSTTATYSTSIAGTAITVQMRDSNKCTQDLTSQTFAALNAPTITGINGSLITCKTGESTSNVDVTVSNGVATLTYIIVSGPTINATGATDGKFTGLANGNYVFKVTDANGCSDIESYTVKPLVNIAASLASQTNVACNAGSTGSASITVSAFTGTYTAVLTAGTGTITKTGSTVDVTGLVQGSYTLRVTDDVTNCFKDVSFTITQPAVVTLTLASNKNANCSQALSKVSVTAGGGKAPYSYAFRNTTGKPATGDYVLNANSADLDPATTTWYAWVKDANGCEQSLTISVAKDPDAVVNVPAQQCYTGSPFDIILSGTGTGTLTYTVNGTISTSPYTVRAAGTYRLGVKDANGCTDFKDYIVEKQIFASAVPNKDLTCKTPTAASITVNIINGTAPFSYQIYDGTTAVGTVVTNITANTFTENFTTPGNYNFEVTDSKGCPVRTNAVPVTPTGTIVANESITNTNCNNSSDGSVTFNPSGGTSPYKISFNGSPLDFNTSFGGLTAGIYNYTIEDARGCTYSNTITINEPNAIIPTFGVHDIKCNSNIPGSIEITSLTNGVGPFVYTLYDKTNTAIHTSAATSSRTYVFPNSLVFGDYTVSIVDNNGCEKVSSKLRISTEPRLKFLPVVISGTCSAGATVDLFLDPTFPSAPDYIYSIVGDPSSVSSPTTNTTYQFTGLNFGQTYYFQVQDNNVCVSVLEVVIPKLSTIDITAITTNNVSCNTTPVLSNGSVNATASNYDSGATHLRFEVVDQFSNASFLPPISFDVPANYPNPVSYGFSNLPVGSYTLVIKEIGGTECSSSVTFEIKQPTQPVSVSVVSQTNDNCNTDARVTVKGTGGNGTYQYTFVRDGFAEPTTGYSSTNPLTLNYEVDDEWDIWVKDINGCTAKVDVTILKDAPPATVVGPAVPCFTGTPFTVDLSQYFTSSVGTPVYTLDGLDLTTSIATITAARTYIIGVRDGNGCVATAPYIVRDILTLGATAKKELDCKSPAPNASITVKAEGGIITTPSSYTYTITAGTTINTTGSTTGIFTDLAAGTYTFEVSDGTCTTTTTATIDALIPIVPTRIVGIPLCVGDAAKVEINATGGTGVYTYGKGAAPTLATQTNNIFSQTAAEGTITYYVKDSNDCVETIDVTVTDPTPLVVTNIALTQMLCGGGNLPTEARITVTATGGAGGFEYSFDNGNSFRNDNFLETTTAGTYNVIVKDANGCTTVAQPAIIDALDPPVITGFNKSQMTCPALESDVTINISNGIGTKTFMIVSGPVTTNHTGDVTGVYTGLPVGDYVFRVTDSNNCTDEELFTVPALPTLQMQEKVVANVDCIGNATGSATFTANDFTASGAFSYNVVTTPSGLAFNQSKTGDVVTLTNMVSGHYEVTFTDNTTLCTVTKSVDISEPAVALSITAVASDVHCYEPISQLTMSPVGGTSTYRYSIVQSGAGVGAYSTATTIDTTTLTNGVVTPNGLGMTWSVDVHIIDSNNCTAMNTVTITKQDLPTVTTPTLASNQCTAVGNYTFTATGTGVGPLSFSTNGTDYFESTGTTYEFTVPAPTAASQSYTVYIKDANGCTATSTTSTTVYKPLTFSVVQDKDITCVAMPVTGAQFTLTASNGNPAYTFAVNINNGGFNTITSPYTTSVTGSYVFRVTDNNNCQVISDEIIINLPVNPAFTTVKTEVKCNGGSTGTIRVTPSGGVGPYTFALSGATPANNTGDATGLYTDLAAGSYTIVVTDSYGCTSGVTPAIVIDEPAILTASASFPLNTACSNTTVITILGGGGTPITPSALGYLYSFDNGVTYDTADHISIDDNKAVQTIWYSVKDANGCTTAPQSIIVNPLNKPNKLDFDATLITCKPGEDVSTVEVKATNGVGALEFRIVATNNATSPTLFGPITTPGSAVAASFPGLLPGDYSFEVKDSNGCTYQDVYTVKELVNIAVNGNLDAGVACKTEANGKVTFTVSNFNTGFTHTITGVSAPGLVTPVGTDTFVLTNLAAGPYTINVTDNVTNCVASFTVNVTEPDQLAVSYITNKNANCDNGAEITATALDGTAGYKYAFVKAGDPKIYTDSDTAVLDKAFTWTLWAKDAHDCEISMPITILVDAMPVIASAIPTQCPSTDGTYDIVVTATGFTANLEYSVDGNSWATNNVLVVKTTGNHTVYVRDENKCVVTQDVNILEPLQLIYELTNAPICNGNEGVVTLTASGGTVTPSYEYSQDGAPYVASNIFTNLVPKTYTFTVRDTGTNCTKDVVVVIDIPNTAIDFSLIPSQTICNGDSTGSITVNMAGATTTVNNNPVYTYAISPSPVGMVLVGNVFTNLPAGLYTVTVTSGKGCPVSQDITVGEPLPISVPTPVVAEYGCTVGNKSNDATITIGLPTGGSNVYTVYEFLRDGNPIPVQRGDNPVYTESDLLGGSYVINVYDSKGCLGTNTAVIKPFISIDFASPSAITVTTPITCTNEESIQVNVITTGTATPMPVLSYNVKGISAGSTYDVTNTDGAFTGLTIGNYTVTVTNPLTGCKLTSIHYVSDPNTFELVATTVNNVSCFGTATGSADLTLVDNQTDPTDDAGAFDYVVSGPISLSGRTTGATLNIPNLTQGVYTVKATLVGSPNCEVERSFTIEQPQASLKIAETHTPISCDPGNDGTISASAQGGWQTGDYLYELVGPVNVAYSTQSYFQNLTAGVYTVNVKDVNGCVDTATVTLKVPDPITFTANATVGVLFCNGDSSGEITVSLPTGGQESNYSYILNNLSANPVTSTTAQSDPVFSGLSAGRYSVTVVDGLSCISVPSPEIEITEPTKVVSELSIETRITCKTDATLTLRASGGSGSYEYSTDQAFTTVAGTFTTSITFAVGLGDHQYYVRDANGCIADISNNITIDALTPLSLNLDLASAVVYCKGSSTASIDATGKGGLGNYIYTLLDGSGNALRPAQSEGYFDLLSKGVYIVRVDSGDCQYDSAPITINEPNEALSVNATATDATCFGANDGKIVIDAKGGTGVIKYAISPNLGQFDDKFVFDRLVPGMYQIIIQDENSCFEIIEREIKEPNILAGKVVGPILQEICDGDKDGAFSIEISGGRPPYSVSLDNETGAYTPVTGTQYDFTGIKGGTHNVYIKDATCITLVEVNMDKAVILDPTAEVNYDCVNNAQSNMVTVTVDESNTDLSQVDYALDSDQGPWQPSHIFTNVAPGSHYIVARHTNGCMVPTANFTIKPYDPLTLALSAGQPEMNIISVTAAGGAPAYEYSFNGEPFTSSNKYKIYKSGDYKVIVRDQNGCTFEITVPAIYVDVCLDNYFTPNGDGVYDTWGPGCTNIYNNLEFSIFDRYGRVIAKYHYGQKWDGRYNGAELPSGDYWYVLKLNDEKDNREFVGHFTLYR